MTPNSAVNSAKFHHQWLPEMVFVEKNFPENTLKILEQKNYKFEKRGGTDIVAMILNKYTSMPVGRALMVSDLGIVLVGAYLYGPATGLYCILGMILKSTVADSAIESINLRKVCTVVTSNPQPVRDFIVNDLHRSATMEQAEGAYTHDEKWVLTTVLTRGQAQKLRLHVRGLDDHAFITIVNSSEIVGKGFRAI
jgi:uncharacterized membrane-anchored protein YitT (DUF2179 family)